MLILLYMCSIVSRIVPLRLRPRYDGTLGAIELAAQGVGPFLSGVLVDKLSWRWCFYINLPCGGISLLLVGLILPYDQPNEARRSHRIAKITQLDWFGMLVFTGSCVALLLALQWGGSLLPWHNARVASLLAVSAAAGLGFIIWHTTRARAFLPVQLFKTHGVVTSALFGFLASSSLVVADYYVSLPCD